MSEALTYHNDPDLKARLINEMREHRKSERLVKGQYWDGSKGCAVGCLLNDPNGGHEKYEAEFGIPEWIARLEDVVFENLPESQSLDWPERLLTAIPVGVTADRMDRARHRLMAWILGPDSPCAAGNQHEIVSGAVAEVRRLHLLSADGERVDLSAAGSAAWSAAWSAAGSAAWAAARSAESAAESAAWAAAKSAAKSAKSAESAAESAAWSAAWSAAGSAAWSAAWSKIADQIALEIENV